MGLMRVREWEQFLWLKHGFSTRSDGFSSVYGDAELNLGFTKDDDSKLVAQNRERFFDATGGSPHGVTLRQVHGTGVVRVKGGESGLEGDGLVTDQVGVLLAVQVADCVPVLVADVRRRVVGAFHAGWRGTAAGMAAIGVERMRAEFGSEAEDMVAAIGPSIGVCCYEVGNEVREAFGDGTLFRGNHLDLWEANRRQLFGAGVRAVSVVGECSACARERGRRKYFSHRAEKGFTGRMMGAIGIGEGS
jgi:YfiH family protein